MELDSRYADMVGVSRIFTHNPKGFGDVSLTLSMDALGYAVGQGP